MIAETLKLTENDTIKILINHLENTDWIIESYCLGQARGYDVVAVKGNKKMFIEVKGARADDDSPTKKRKHFDSGQIKTHLGKAIVKVLNDKYINPAATIAIAHPNDKRIKKAIGHLTPYLRHLDIKHFWVSPDGQVESDW